MDKVTCEDIWNEEGLVSVDRKSDDGWRHGCYITEVFKREADETYWLASYELSTDGESNGLREGTAQISQVRPIEKVVRDWELVK